MGHHWRYRGARLVHVIDFWDDIYRHDPIEILYVWEGGIAIYGAILGGFAGGSLYIIVRNSSRFLTLWGRLFRFAGEPHKAPLPGIGRLADITAPALLISMAIGRIGDIINGGAFRQGHRFTVGPNLQPLGKSGVRPDGHHPAVAYELLFDLALLAIIWPLRHRLRPNGMVFTLYLAMYSTGRFFLSFLREEFNEYAGLNEAQLISLVVMAVTIPLLVYKAKLVQTVPQKAVPRRRAR